MKKKPTYIKKHILIPLLLSGFVITIGIFLTITDTTTAGRFREYRYGQDKMNAKTINQPVSGPQIIISGVIMTSIILFIWTRAKK